MSLVPSGGSLQTLHSLVQLSGFKRLNESVKKPGHVAGLRWRQIADGHRAEQRRYGIRCILGAFDLGEIEHHRTIFAGWNEASKAKRRDVTVLREFDRFRR